jgi:hypothetical protein
LYLSPGNWNSGLPHPQQLENTAMNTRRQRRGLTATTASILGIMAIASLATAAPYTVAYTDGSHWNTVYVQGFNTSLGANPNPAPSNGAPVYLTQFQFFKSGNPDSAANIQLAILNNLFPGSPTVNNLTTSSAPVVGISSNTISSTASIATGSPISFTFNNLPLVYGTDYAAMFVNVGAGGALTPVLVSALDANYVDIGGGNFHPATNYGTESQFNYATSNFINNGFFTTFSFAGDADFSATINTVPEPASWGMLMFGGIAGLAFGRYQRRSAA